MHIRAIALPRVSWSLAFAALLMAESTAQGWVQRTPTSSPSPRDISAAAFDVARGVTVLFGGYAGAPPGLADTWEWNGSNWAQRTTAVVPAGRWGHSMAYDNHRMRTVMFGGYIPSVGTVSDTWEYDGSNWALRTPVSLPPVRGHAALAYDSTRNVTVLYGGYLFPSTYYDDTWEWNGNNWVQRSPQTAPSGRRGPMMTYDSVRGEMVMFGGANGTAELGDTWVYGGTNWTQRQPSTAPGPRLQGTLAYDSMRGKAVLHGGADRAFTTTYGDSWEWDGSVWAQVQGAGPSPRVSATMVYDARRGVLALSGGSTAGLALADTWESVSYRGAGGVKFDGGNLVFPHHSVMLTGIAATMEAWIKAVPTTQGVFTCFSRYTGYQEHKALYVEANGRIGFLYAGSPWWQLPNQDLRTPPGTFPFDGAFHHLAFVRRANGTWSIYLDGSRIVNGGPGSGLWSGCWLTCNVIETNSPTLLGGDAAVRDWTIRSMRVSNIERYSGASIAPSQAWATDANTAMLLNFAEGLGTTTTDSGPAQQVGTFTGAFSWMAGPGATSATFATYGHGCEHSNGFTEIAAAPGSLPRLGSTFTARFANVPGLFNIVIPIYGYSNTSWGGAVLPQDLAAYGMPGCQQYVQPVGNVILLNTIGSVDFQLAIPSDPGLMGLPVFMQALVFDPFATNLARAATTNAGIATIGW